MLRNDSGYSAKNPAVIVRLHAMAFEPANADSFEQNWASMDVEIISWPAESISESTEPLAGLTVVQWDGGPTYSIHGNSTRRLPDLLFTQLWHKPEWGTPTLTFEILAEGYRKEITLPVDFIVDGKSRFPRAGGKINPEWI